MRKISNDLLIKIDVLTTRLFNFIDELPNRNLSVVAEKISYTTKINEIRMELNLQPIYYPSKRINSKEAKVTEKQIFVLKATCHADPKELERIRAEVAQQIESGVVVIPRGLDFEIVHVKEEK